MNAWFSASDLEVLAKSADLKTLPKTERGISTKAKREEWAFEKVDGKGKKILEDSGIAVVSGVLEDECRELNKRFFTFHQKKRPYIILKWAESEDGFLDKDFKPTAVSNSLAKQWVHQLRADEHAILVGKNTALNDNPSLTTREVFGKNPVQFAVLRCR